MSINGVVKLAVFAQRFRPFASTSCMSEEFRPTKRVTSSSKLAALTLGGQIISICAHKIHLEEGGLLRGSE